jgi:hypothetical protein
MKKYDVEQVETIIRHYKIEANSEYEAEEELERLIVNMEIPIEDGQSSFDYSNTQEIKE